MLHHLGGFAASMLLVFSQAGSLINAQSPASYPTLPQLPYAVYDHSLTVNGASVFLIGGTKSNFDQAAAASSAVWSLSPNDANPIWSPHTSFSSSNLLQIAGHSALLTNNGLLAYFGNWTTGSNGFPGVTSVNGTNISNVNSTSLPPARTSHAMALDPQFNRTLIYGGKLLSDNSASYNIYYHDPAKSLWAALTTNNSSTLSNNTNSQSVHPGFLGASMVKPSLPYIVICFGMMATGQVYNGCSLFSLSTLSWVNPVTNSSTSPPARYEQTIFRHPSKSDNFILFGGADPSLGTVYNDIWQLDASNAPTLIWRLLSSTAASSSAGLLARFKHSGFIFGSDFVVVGGLSSVSSSAVAAAVGSSNVFYLGLPALINSPQTNSTSSSSSSPVLDNLVHMLPWLIPVVAVALIGLVVATFMVCRQRRRRRNDSHVTITNSSSSGNKWLYKRNKGRIASPAAETTEDEKTEYFTPFSIAARHVRFMSKSPPAATAAGDDIMTNAADDESDIYAAARKNRHIGTATPPALSLPALSTAIVASPGVMVPPPASMRALAPPSTTVSQQQQLLSQVLLPPALASSSAAFNGSIAAMQPLPVSTVVAVPISTPLCAPPSSMNSTNLVSASSISPPQPVTLSPPPVTKSTNVAINRPVSAFQSVSNTSRSLPVIGANTVLPHVAMDMDTVSDLDSWKSCVDIEPNRLSRAAAAGASGTVSTADKPLVNNISAASATINIDGGDGEFFDEVIDIEDADVFKKYLRFATSDSSVPRLSFTFK